MKKILIVYYSLDGNTEAAAEQIAEAIGADILRLIPKKEIPAEAPRKFMVGGMKAAFGMRTPIKKPDLDPLEYERIILGTPVWADKCALAVNTFLRKYKVSDRITDVFTCSGGGDNGPCITYLKKKLTNLRSTVALADRNNADLAGGNEEKLKAFIEKLKTE